MTATDPKETSELRFSLATIIVLFLHGCTPPAEQPEPSRRDSAAYNADMQAILDLEQSVFDAQIAGDLEAWLSSFAEDAIVMAPNLPAVTNKLAIRQWYAPYFEQFHLHEEVDQREVEVAGDWAYIRAHWIWTLTPKNGGEAVIDIGKSIWILRRQPDGSWKIARAIYNSDIPLSGQE
jgi:uncharacterized protein (TIGR02246 family)